MAVPPTIVSFPGDGATTTFTFQFDYLNPSYVQALVDGVAAPFTFTSTKVIELSEAPAAGSTLVISRVTERERLVDFTDGSVLVEDDLDLANIQVLHIVQEAIDLSGTTLSLQSDGSLDAAGRRLSVVGEPQQANDAVTKSWAETAMASQLASAITAAANALASQNAASASEAAAAVSETNAATSEANASDSEDAAEVSETNAAASEAIALAAAGDASASAAVAAASEANVIAALGTSIIPAGAVSQFARQTPPTGWLKCDGSAVNRTAYADLFAAIGTTFGSGDGSSTFNLPDLRGEFVRGWDDGRGVDASRQFGSSQDDALEEHGHMFTGEAARDGEVSGTPNWIMLDNGNLFNKTDQITATHIDPATANVAEETRPRNVALLMCIKT